MLNVPDMSSKLALSQLKSLVSEKERPHGDKEIRKTIRKKRRSVKKQQQQQRQEAAKQQISQLEYYKATTTTQKSTAELMSKVSEFTASHPFGVVVSK